MFAITMQRTMLFYRLCHRWGSLVTDLVSSKQIRKSRQLIANVKSYVSCNSVKTKNRNIIYYIVLLLCKYHVKRVNKMLKVEALKYVKVYDSIKYKDCTKQYDLLFYSNI